MNTKPQPSNVKSEADFKGAAERAKRVIEENLVTFPPVNVFDIALNYGLEVVYAPFGEMRDVAGFINLDTKQIVVNDMDSVSRQRFTIAHELGHWLMHKDALMHNPNQGVLLRRPLGAPDPDPREKEANCFAANLLVPGTLLAGGVIADVRENMFIGHERLLSKVFGVSPDVITFRLMYPEG